MNDPNFVNEGAIVVESAGNKLLVRGGNMDLKASVFVEVELGAELEVEGHDYSAFDGTFTYNEGTMKARKCFNGGLLGGNENSCIGDVLTEKPGVASPGNSEGTLTVVGDYEQIGMLEIELGETAVDSEYDVLVVTGSASFFGGSGLQVQLIGDDTEDPFQPKLGDVFDAVHADTILDQGLLFDFSVLPGLGFSDESVNTGSAQALRLRVVVPEPAAGQKEPVD